MVSIDWLSAFPCLWVNSALIGAGACARREHLGWMWSIRLGWTRSTHFRSRGLTSWPACRFFRREKVLWYQRGLRRMMEEFIFHGHIELLCVLRALFVTRHRLFVDIFGSSRVLSAQRCMNSNILIDPAFRPPGSSTRPNQTNGSWTTVRARAFRRRDYGTTNVRTQRAWPRWLVLCTDLVLGQ